MPGAFPVDQKTATPAEDASADFIALPDSESMSWTPINPAHPKLRRSARLLTRARRATIRVAMPQRRRRSPSVEFLGSRLRGTEGPLDVADPAAGAASLTRPRSSSVEFVLERLRDDTLLEQAEGSMPGAVGPESLKDAATPSPQPGERLVPLRPNKRAQREALRSEMAQAQGPYVAHQVTAAGASGRLPGAQETPEGSEELMIYTDGSCLPPFGGAGIAYRRGSTWMGRATALGVVRGSGEAELAAIFGAVKLARRVREANEYRITIATDSLECLTRLNPDKAQVDPSEPGQMARAIVQGRRELATEGIHLGFRWVKGHASIEGNELADKLAGFGAKEAAKGLATYFNVADVYAQFPELASKPMIKDLAAGLQQAYARRHVKQTVQQDRRALKLRRRRELARQAARVSSDQLIASRFAEIASQTLRETQQGV